jgi:hypothetical protein
MVPKYVLTVRSRDKGLSFLSEMYKALGLIRALGKAGCEVVLADQGS